MIDEMSEGKAVDYDYIAKNKDIDDYWKWRSCRSRENKITKYFINKDKNSNPSKNIKGNSISSEEFRLRDMERRKQKINGY